MYHKNDFHNDSSPRNKLWDLQEKQRQVRESIKIVKGYFELEGIGNALHHRNDDLSDRIHSLADELHTEIKKIEV